MLAAYVEEVRIGFQHWGEAIVHELDEDGLYKLSNGFVIDKQADELDTFLAMPADARHPQVRSDWDAIRFNEGPAKIPVEMASRSGEDPPAFAATGAKMISIRRARLQDFTTYYDASLMNPKVLIGVFLGAMATFVFCAMTMKAVGRAAKGMVEEVRRQFRENPAS